ncbi:MAG: XRE family transcriptional regulator [Lactobacillus sp.]|nr:MAG: XRE family transcriptional regulator [Lactobacillus sp.]
MSERKWLKQYREYLRLSQDQMALKLDVPKSTYTSYESGYRTLSVDRAKKLAPKINVSWSIFLKAIYSICVH